MLRIECAKCGRKGRYSVARLLEQYGPDELLETFRRPLIENCPRFVKRDYNDQCDAVFPDLIKVLKREKARSVRGTGLVQLDPKHAITKLSVTSRMTGRG